MDRKVIHSFIWKLLERFSAQIITFIISLLLARLLDPNHYGMMSIITIFITLADIFIHNGFNTSLIQSKSVDDDDYSSVFWISEIVAIILCVILFFCIPYIAIFYNMFEIIIPFRVMSLVLIPGAYNSIQIAKINRELDFKKLFILNTISNIFGGILGIITALFGFGLWSLVIQRMSGTLLSCIVLSFIVKWKPKFVFNIERVKVLFSFGWKLLISSLLDTGYQNLQSLVIGKKYDTNTLAYNDRGKHFSQFIMSAVNDTVLAVMLPTMSKEQDNVLKVKSLTQKSMTVTSYLVFPMMAGLAAIAKPLVTVLLTEKWLECVPYMQIYCFIFAFYPVHSCNLQALNALGRSDLFLKLEIIKKTYGIISIIIAVFCFNSPLAICGVGLVTTWLGWFVNSYPNKKLLNYSMKEQLLDLLPSILVTLIMFIGVLLIGKLNINNVLLLIIQIISGILIYFVFSMIIKPSAFIFIKEYALDIINNIGKTNG